MIAIDEQRREDPEADQRQAVLLELPPGELVLAEGLEADLVVDRGRCGISSGRVSMSSTATSARRCGPRRVRPVAFHESSVDLADARVDDRVRDVGEQVRQDDDHAT